MATEMVKYVNRPDLLSEIFYQIYDTFNYDSVLRLALLFFDDLNDLQIQKIGENYIGDQFLEHFASLFLNPTLQQRLGKEKFYHIPFNLLYIKIQRNRLTQIHSKTKPFVGDIVPNNTGISDRFERGHDGIHIRSPKMGGNVITIESLQGIVIRQYLQDAASPTTGNYNLYGVWILLKTGIVVVYKDMRQVDAKLRKLKQGQLYLIGNKPTSNIFVKTNDLIGTIRPWYKDDDQNIKNDVGLHLTFIKLQNIQDYKDHLRKNSRDKVSNPQPFPLEKLIFPCGDESPVRCIG